MICPICSNSKISAKNHEKYKNLWHCTECKLIFIYPQLTNDDLKKIYGADYFKNSQSHFCGYENYQEDKKSILQTFNHRLELLEKIYKEKGILLDVGCAMGFMLEAAEARGWDVYGIDVSKEALAVAKKRFGKKVYTEMLENAVLPENHFDLITIWDTLEHLTDPVKTIRRCWHLLKPGGLLAFTVPDVGSLIAKIIGDRWMGYKEEHLFYFTRRSIKHLLNQSDFIIQKIKYEGKYITLGAFAKRLTLYSPLLAGIIQGAVKLLNLENHDIYINPLDISLVIAKKQWLQKSHNP